MLSSRVARLRDQLIEIHQSGVPLQGRELGSIILAIVLIEDRVRDLEERFTAANPEAAQAPTNVVSFPSKPKL